MKNKKPMNKGCTPQELEVVLRAKRERRVVSFENGFPKIADRTNSTLMEELSASLQEALGTESRVDGILTPASDLLSLFDALEGYISYYVAELSKADLRREDCLHMYEPGTNNGATPLSDDLLQKITERLGRITAERRHIKNRYEVIKFIHSGFMSGDGKAARLFLSKLLGDVAHLEKAQKERIYTPKTDAVADIWEAAVQPPLTTTCPSMGDSGEIQTTAANGQRRYPQKKRRGSHVSD